MALAVESNDRKELKGVVFGHQVCQTQEAKWLCIDDAYSKFQRPNLYDIGGTYMQDVADFWFNFKTEQVGQIYLLHLFVNNHHEGSFDIAISESNKLRCDIKIRKVYLLNDLKHFHYKKIKERSLTYIKTFNFSNLDVDMMNNRQLFIPLSIPKENDVNEIFDNIKVDHDLGALLNDPICADFTIEAEDGKQFKVHKIVLEAFSEVFKAMLKEDTAESQNSLVKLKDVASEDLQAILEFIYTGAVKDIENSNCYHLLNLADRYNIKGLADLSEYALSHQLTLDNVFEILVVADMHNSQVLKLDAFKFIKKHLSLLQSKVFEEVKDAQLSRELCTYLVLS